MNERQISNTGEQNLVIKIDLIKKTKNILHIQENPATNQSINFCPPIYSAPKNRLKYREKIVLSCLFWCKTGIFR
jgi:hypothetical protein